MTNDNLNTAIERLFDALEDLNRVRGRRDALEELDTDEKVRRVRESDDLSDVWEPEDAGQLQIALQHIEAARGKVAEEIEATTPHSQQAKPDDNTEEGGES